MLDTEMVRTLYVCKENLIKKTLKTEEVDRINLNTVGDSDVLIQLSAALDTAESKISTVWDRPESS